MRLIPDSHHCPLSTAAYTVYLLHVCSLCSPLFEWLAATVTQGSIARYLSITLIQPIQPAPGRPHKPLTLIYIKPGSTSVISTADGSVLLETVATWLMHEKGRRVAY